MKKSKIKPKRVLSREEVYSLLIEKYETLLDENLAKDYFDRAKDNLIFLRVLAGGLGKQLEDIISNAEERIEKVYRTLEENCLKKMESEAESGEYFFAVHTLDDLERTAKDLGRQFPEALQKLREELRYKEHAKDFLQYLLKASQNCEKAPYIARDDMKKALECAGYLKFPAEGLKDLRDRIVEDIWKDYGRYIIKNVRTNDLQNAEFHARQFEDRVISALMLQ
jgi:hypothetical protein